ncbi:cytochrome c oxidase subunit 3 [Flavilitoribacter nigricans]|uniref:Cytochrome oxidase subunit III n=1 Tax=Flavilitoribacter nigricans (strain ATCC 23147 / DSM 23189 / NBRC 102662 / NCIMB 1420 / SS-2) TaxID=1122177 RepID=A0A2D0N9E5_FLAN2|nr:cytochrome c oxidase subunit 3 [Flavilitoribacter nigricans]PHN05008.1 cytochrome oxidase subunit III [Flavilitoribacter nigricans DSM 23189 = NBRC 102662]
MNDVVVNNTLGRNKIHPKKFALWVACGSIMMMFAALTSAYIVRRAGGNWLEFQLPAIFTYNTITILASSLSLHLSYRAFLRGNSAAYKGLLLVTLALGLLFVGLQYEGWTQLEAMGVPLRLNPSGDFIYVISAVHAAHVLGGIATLIVASLHAFTLPNKVTPARKLRFQLTFTYWHFVDFLWLYLLVFLMQQS